MDAAHDAGLTHRDVKPSNLLVTARRGFVYLIDFGIAHGDEATRVTSTGAVIGSLPYMAPERFTGEFDTRSDLHSLACVLHECLTGAPPFGNSSPERQIHDHLVATARPASRANSTVPSELDASVV